MTIVPNESLNPTRCLRTLRIIWLFMLTAVGLDAGIGFLPGAVFRFEAGAALPRQTLLSSFYGAAILLFAAILFIRRQIPPTGKAVSLPLTHRRPTYAGVACSRYTRLSLITFALSEMIGLLGLILYLLIHERNPFFFFLAFGNFACRPVALPAQTRGARKTV